MTCMMPMLDAHGQYDAVCNVPKSVKVKFQCSLYHMRKFVLFFRIFTRVIEIATEQCP